MASNNTSRRADPLAMQIYAALLGNTPKVARNPPTKSRLKFQLRVETAVRTSVESPFRKPSLMESIERAAAEAIGALSDAGDRLRRSRTRISQPDQSPATRGESTGSTEGTSKSKPIVLIGPAAIRGSQRLQAARQAQEARRPAAA